MNTEINNPIFQVIDETFEKSTKTDLEKYYLKLTNGVKKWTCYSDYCFGDSNKPNDVVCFTLIPYIVDFEKLSNNKLPIEIKEKLTEKDKRVEKIMLGLRTIWGVELDLVNLSKAKILVDNRFAYIKNNRLILNMKGLSVINEIVLQLI